MPNMDFVIATHRKEEYLQSFTFKVFVCLEEFKDIKGANRNLHSIKSGYIN